MLNKYLDDMKKYIPIICGLLLVLMPEPKLNAQSSASISTSVEAAVIDTPKVVGEQERFYEFGNFYIGPQPDEDELEWFAENGVSLVVNARTVAEMEKYTDEDYDEAELAGELGMSYVNLPLGGEAGYSPEDVDSLAKYISENDKKVVLHCRSGVRVAHLLVAYLIKAKNVSIDDAVEIGKKMNMRILFEEMLDYPITRSELIQE